MLDSYDRQRTVRTRTWAWGGILGLLLTVWVATATWAFDDAEPAEVGLHGILAAEVPEGLTDEAFSVLDGNWEKWSIETAELVAKLYEDDSLDLAAQKKDRRCPQSRSKGAQPPNTDLPRRNHLSARKRHFQLQPQPATSRKFH